MREIADQMIFQAILSLKKISKNNQMKNHRYCVSKARIRMIQVLYCLRLRTNKFNKTLPEHWSNIKTVIKIIFRCSECES